MMKKIALTFASLALVASAASNSYNLTLFQPSLVAGSQLKAGEYKLNLQDNKVVIKQGKVTAESPVKVETIAEKYGSTSVKYVNGAIQEIRLGGTHTKLVFEKVNTAD